MGKPFTILWHSVAAITRSGYGKVTYNVCTRLASHGYRVVNSAYYGLDPGEIINVGGVIVVPAKRGSFGQESAIQYAKQFKADLAALHTDWWAFSIFAFNMPIPKLLYSPMDHINYPHWIIEMTKRYEYIVSLCKFQYEELKRRGIESTIIPHGVNTKVYRPLNKELCKEKLNVKGKFVFGTIAANTDKEPRKSHFEMMKAMSYFLEQNPDVRKDIVWIYHSDPLCPQGVNLSQACEKFGLNDIIRFMNPEMSDIMLTEEELVELINTFDVFLLASRREGFCLPLLESFACGVPAIGHNFSSFPELIGNTRGWLAKSAVSGLNLITTPILAECPIVDVYDLARCIKEAYFQDKRREAYGRNAYKFAQGYDWDKIVEEQWIPYLKGVEEELKGKSKPVEERRIL